MAVRIQLSNFAYVKRPKNQGNALRFSFAMRVDLPNDLAGEFAVEGNIAFLKSDGQLTWSPPLNRISRVTTMQLHWVNPTLFDIILDLLKEHPDLLRNLVNPLQQLMQAKLIQNVDDSLPRLIEGVKEDAKTEELL